MLGYRVPAQRIELTIYRTGLRFSPSADESILFEIGLNDVEIFQAGRSVENDYAIVWLDPASFKQTS